MSKVFGIIDDLVRPHHKLESGYYRVKAQASSSWEIAYLTKAKKWLWLATLQSFTPHEVGKRIEIND